MTEQKKTLIRNKTPQQAIKEITTVVQRYIDNFDLFGPDPAVMIDPDTLEINFQTTAERDNNIYLSDATVEEAAAIEGLADQDGMDYQSGRNWDIYPVHKLMTRTAPGHVVPDTAKITEIVNAYFLDPDNSRTPYTE